MYLRAIILGISNCDDKDLLLPEPLERSLYCLASAVPPGKPS